MKPLIKSYDTKFGGQINKVMSEVFGCKYYDVNRRKAKVLLQDSNLIGFTIYIESKHEIEIYYFCILPEYQNKGFGKIMLNYFKERATKKGKIIVLTPMYNVAEFYTRSGFMKTGEINKKIEGKVYDCNDLVFVPIPLEIKTED